MLAPVEFSPEKILLKEIRPENLTNLIKAADVADSIFWEQMFPNYEGLLKPQDRANQELREFIQFNYGPYDILNDDAAVLPVGPKQPGVGFYPASLSRDEFVKYVKNHPERAAIFQSPYTVIRGVNAHLKAVPYHIAYRGKVNQLSDMLNRARAVESHPAFREFLGQRAGDILTDDYFTSESTWVRLNDNPLDLVIGPYEVYEDQLMGLKSSYEARVLWRDFAESEKIQHFQREIPSLCKTLGPYLSKMLVMSDSRLELSVADILYAGGFARKGIPAIALTLPNDEKVIEEVGSRQIILKNILEAKFNNVAWPVINRVLLKPPSDPEQSRAHFFSHTLFHEISHSIGPHIIKINGETTTINRSLRQYYSVLEEAKADALGACILLSASDNQNRQVFLDLFVAGFLRSIRYGQSHAHGGANIIQFNYLLKQGAFDIDSNSGKIRVNHDAAHRAILKLATEIIRIQEKGDFDLARHFFERFCIQNELIKRLLRELEDIPVDIRIKYRS